MHCIARSRQWRQVVWLGVQKVGRLQPRTFWQHWGRGQVGCLSRLHPTDTVTSWIAQRMCAVPDGCVPGPVAGRGCTAPRHGPAPSSWPYPATAYIESSSCAFSFSRAAHQVLEEAFKFVNNRSRARAHSGSALPCANASSDAPSGPCGGGRLRGNTVLPRCRGHQGPEHGRGSPELQR